MLHTTQLGHEPRLVRVSLRAQLQISSIFQLLLLSLEPREATVTGVGATESAIRVSGNKRQQTVSSSVFVFASAMFH